MGDILADLHVCVSLVFDFRSVSNGESEVRRTLSVPLWVQATCKSRGDHASPVAPYIIKQQEMLLVARYLNASIASST